MASELGLGVCQAEEGEEYSWQSLVFFALDPQPIGEKLQHSKRIPEILKSNEDQTHSPTCVWFTSSIETDSATGNRRKRDANFRRNIYLPYNT